MLADGVVLLVILVKGNESVIVVEVGESGPSDSSLFDRVAFASAKSGIAGGLEAFVFIVSAPELAPLGARLERRLPLTGDVNDDLRLKEAFTMLQLQVVNSSKKLAGA